MGECSTIPNTLVDVLLLIGMDDDTNNYQPISKIDKNYNLSVDDITPDPQVLVAASASDMVKFFPFPQRISGYPPEIQSIQDTKSKHKDRKGQFSPSRPRRSTSLKPSMLLRQASVRRPGTIISTPSIQASPIPEFPISEEVIRSIPSLCFPDGMTLHTADPPENSVHYLVLTDMTDGMSLHTAPPENSVHYLVLTDMAGNKSYACCITFSRKFVAEKDDQGYLYMSLETDRHTDTCTDKLSVYIPHCCITISQYPYYTKMKECLSSLVSCINKDPEELYIFLKEYSHILMKTPVPPAGNVALELNLNQLPVILKPTSHPDKPVLDLPLHLIFLYFNIEEFMKILVYILQEERLVFLADNYSLLTVIMESFRYLILPFEWRFTYVTVLPSNGLGYLQAPGTFMFGCHSDHKYEVEQIDGLVLVDINLGEVTLNPDTTTVNDKQSTVPCLPADAARLFVEASQKFRLLIDSEFLQRPCFHNFEELKQFQAKKETEINEVITQGCLELMVNLFRSVIANIRVEQRYFNKEQFLNQYFGTDRTFYEKVLTTDMFKKFLEDRMNEKKDYWSDLERKTRETLRRGSVQIPTRLSELLYNRRPSSTLLVKKEMRVFKLPDVTNTKHYVEHCCKTLDSKIQECPDYDDRMSYIYLRAMFNMAANNNMAALEDFITLSSSFTRILPSKHLVDAYNRLSSVEKAQFVKKPGHEGLLDIIEATESADEQTEHRGQKIRMDPIPMPESDLNYEEFKEYITLQNMSEDFETIKRLFEALTINSKNQNVDQTTLTLCVEHWINNRNQCDHVKFDEDRLQEEEIILKMSDLIKTDFGLGRIGLTDKRLFFLVNVTNKYSEIAKLQDIVKLEKSQYYGIFRSGTDILIIHKKDNTVFTANLKEERNWWYLLIYEMWAGRKVFVEAKDIMALQLAAQNTLLMDAVIASGQDDLTVHSTCPSEAASRLGYYSQYVDKGKHVLTGDTKQKLQTKIDPNIGEHDRKTVQALLYTGGDDCSVPPKLWCGLSDGKIKVYNASTWMLEGNPIQTKQSVACLTAIDDEHVWAGSYGIYIISAETITCTKTLMEHQDLVVDIVPYDNYKYVFSASLEGTIIKWDVKKLTRETVVNLQTQVKCLRSLKIYDDKMFCGSWSSILMCDMRGEIIHQFQTKDGNKIKELDSFIILPSGEMLTGCRRESLIFVWNIEKKEQEGEIKLPDDCRGVSVMSQTHNQVWVGSKEGIIRTFDMNAKQMMSTLQVHEDAVRVLCPVTDRYMVSGGGSMDGKVCMWSLLAHSTDSGQFMDTLEESPTHFGP